ncbi:MAG: cytochrome C oxidase subunit IV family protein [Schleiferiaceae bacterium]|jgi:cytochrome c oxidase subunit IV|nr:cytochrome C oxidase subunit IV family protein [Schleiferiaceae bacterium]
MAGNSTAKLWKTFFILLALTIVEVALGIVKPGFLMAEVAGTSLLNSVFIILTIIKAYFIVAVFMHLGDEKKSFQWAVYLPALILIPYLTFILLVEGNYTFDEAVGIY